MATERQIEANRRNAARSTGPSSEAGKAASRGNAVKHGLACEHPGVEAERSPAYRARLAAWSAEYRPVGPAQEWAMGRAVAASLRIERCEGAVDSLAASSAERAELAWDQDREVEAARLAARLARDPVTASRKLETTWHGVNLLIERWDRLGRALEGEDEQGGEGWSDDQVATALDLLGVPRHLRTGPLPIDDPEGGPASPFRRELVEEELGRLRGLRDEAMEPLDDLARDRATSGRSALLDPSVRLALRYEREAWRAYRESIAALSAPSAGPAVKPEPPAIAIPAPEPEPVAARPTSPVDPRAVFARMARDLGTPAMAPAPEVEVEVGPYPFAGTNPIPGGIGAIPTPALAPAGCLG